MRSLLKGALMSFLRMCEGAVKYALRDFLRELLTVAFCFILAHKPSVSLTWPIVSQQGAYRKVAQRDPN